MGLDFASGLKRRVRNEFFHRFVGWNLTVRTATLGFCRELGMIRLIVQLMDISEI